MIEIQGLSFSYGKARGKKELPVLSDISFLLENGSCAAVLGVNGAGKSTLIKCIDRILHPQAGKVLIDGQDVTALSGRGLAQKIAYVPQNGDSSDMTVFDSVLLGRRPYIRWDMTEHDREIAMMIIGQLKLEHLMLRNLSQLSGGERQKVYLARALAQEPALLLLDEPTSNLDPRNQHDALRLVRDIAAEKGICVMMVLHDLSLAIRYCDQFLLLKDRGVYAKGGRECMTEKAIEAVYGMPVRLLDYDGVPVVIPFPSEKAELA